MRAPIIPVITALLFSALGAGVVWLMTDNAGKALTAGAIGLLIGLGIYAASALSAGKDVR